MQPGSKILGIYDGAEAHADAVFLLDQASEFVSLFFGSICCGRPQARATVARGRTAGGKLADVDWTDEENDLIVADYLDMLVSELAGLPYVKANHRRALLPKLRSIRNEGSIEFKHQNISAVMLGLGQPRINGYKPASQFQLSLIDAVLRRLEKYSDWSAVVTSVKREKNPSYAPAAEAPALIFGPPPTHSNAPPPVDP